MSLMQSVSKVVLMALLLYAFGQGLWGRVDLYDIQAQYLVSMKQILDRGAPEAIPVRVSDLADGVKESVNASMNAAMRELFDELDSNKDGVIEYNEFIGMTLNTWAAFRAFDLALKSRLQLPSFRQVRQTMRAAFERGVQELDLPDELRNIYKDLGYFETLRRAAWWYFLMLLYIQCALCVFENTVAFLGLRAFTFRPKTEADVRNVRRVPKEEALRYDTPLKGFYEKAKIFVMTVSGLAALRLLQVVFFVGIGMTSVNVGAMVPSHYWRAFWLRGVTGFCIQATFFSLGYYRVGVEGKVCSPEEAKILLGNHCAVVELLQMFGLSFPSFISAAENEAVPLFAGVVRACNAILVDRLDKNSKRKTMEEIRRRCNDPEAPQLMIFPEGTLNNQRALFTFKPGAFEPGMPVQPICFRFPFKHFNPCWTGEYTGGNEIGETLWRGVCQLVNRLEVKILPVYRPSEEEKADKMLFAENVRKLMAAHLEIGISDCRYEDYLALSRRYAEMKRVARQEEGVRRPRRWWGPFFRPFEVDLDELMSPYSDRESVCSADDVSQ